MLTDDRPAAALIWLTVNKITYTYKVAHDPEFNQYPSGTVLIAHLMEHVINVDNVNLVNFLPGDNQHKKE
jgi:hypothetical protein